MQILLYSLYALEVIAALLLVCVVMLQPPKDPSGGMGAIGGGMGEAVFGAQMGNVLTKATVVLAVILICNTVAIAKLNTMRSGSVMDSLPTAPAQSAPDLPLPPVE